MTNRNLFVALAAACASLALFSCAREVETAQVSFSFSEDAARQITRQASGSWNVVITLSGDYPTTRRYEIGSAIDGLRRGEESTFTVDDLPVGATVSVDVSVSLGALRYYKTKTPPPPVTLGEGANFVAVTLTKEISNADIAIEDAKSVSIAASADGHNYDASDQQPPALPYTSPVTFTLSGGAGAYSADSYLWYLNGQPLSGGGNTITLTLANENAVRPSDGEVTTNNSLVCFFDVAGARYRAEFGFTTPPVTQQAAN